MSVFIDRHAYGYHLSASREDWGRSASRSSRRPRRSDGARLKKDPAEGREWIHHLARDRSTRGSEALGASTVHLSVTLATWVPTPGRDEHQQQRHSKGVQLETTAGRIISFREGYSRAWCWRWCCGCCYCLQGAGCRQQPQPPAIQHACGLQPRGPDRGPPFSWGAVSLSTCHPEPSSADNEATGFRQGEQWDT
jgi:hypothetical protein